MVASQCCSDTVQILKSAPDVPRNIAGENQIAAAKNYIQRLNRRIERALKGHALWISINVETRTGGEGFSAHQWCSGRRIDDYYWLSPPSLVDTPLQVLKLSCISKHIHLEYLDSEPETEGQQWVASILRPKIRAWVDHLHTLNRRGFYTFLEPCEQKERYDRGIACNEDQKYRLCDHVMIIQALKYIQDNFELECESLAHYEYDSTRRKALKRFATEDPISQQKTLATSRWANKTRFLFHSKDTYLFFAADSGFFIRPSPSSKKQQTKSDGYTQPWRFLDDRWSKLLDAQGNHDEYQQMNWTKPLWYAVVYVLSLKSRQLDGQSPESLVKSTRAALLEASLYNGLAPGSLSEDGVPGVYEKEQLRDHHWFSSFEIPNILCRFKVEDSTVSSTAKFFNISASNINSSGTSTRKQNGKQIGKYVPFANTGRMKDKVSHIVLLDDWLQAPSAVLDFVSKHSCTIHAQARDQCKQKLSMAHAAVLLGINRRTEADASGYIPGYVIDVPTLSMGHEMLDAIPMSLKELQLSIAERRSVWKSKKRIIWSSQPNIVASSHIEDVCEFTSSDGEIKNLPLFFKRHREFKTHFLDSSIAAVNEWETELYFSFYALFKRNQQTSRTEDLYSLGALGFITSTTMSLRFSGDFSDRYWTCYFFEHRGEGQRMQPAQGLRPDPSRGIKDGLDLSKEDWKSSDRRKYRDSSRQRSPWQQRKVLELLFLSMMLEQLQADTSVILQAVKRLALRSDKIYEDFAAQNRFEVATEEAALLQELGEHDYTSVVKQWHEYDEVLHIVEDKLAENLQRIQQWNDRENDRQGEQPRWTERDRRSHATTVLRLTILTQ